MIGEDTRIGAGTQIGAHSVIGAGCWIGENCRIHPHVTLYCRRAHWASSGDSRGGGAGRGWIRVCV